MIMNKWLYSTTKLTHVTWKHIIIDHIDYFSIIILF